MKELLKKSDELILKIKEKGDIESFSFEDSKIIICAEKKQWFRYFGGAIRYLLEKK